MSLGYHVLTIWNDRKIIAAGHGDFIIYYTGAKILRDGHGAALYDLKMQEKYQDRFHVAIRQGPLPYNHPAYELLLFLPLVRLSYAQAYWVWTAINLLLLIGICRLLLPAIGAAQKILCALAVFGFFPVAAALWQGQDSILSAFLVSAALVSLKHKRALLSGGVLALGLYKPQLVIPVALVFIFKRCWRAFGAFTVTGAALAVISVALVGWPGTLEYLQLLSWMNANHPSIDPSKMANLRGLLGNLSDAGATSAIVNGLVGITSAGLFAWTLSAWKGKFGGDDELFDLKCAHLIVATVLLSYHLYVHDTSLLAIPLTVMLNAGMRPGQDASKLLSFFLIAFIAFSMPVVELLLATRTLSWVALLLILLAVVLKLAISHRQASAARNNTCPI